MSDTQTTHGGKRPRAGRKPGTRLIEPSTLVRRLRMALEPPLTQEDFGRKFGASTRSVARYENESVIPKSGSFRAAVERAAKRAGVAIHEEPQT